MHWPPFFPTIILIHNLKKLVVKEALENVLARVRNQKWKQYPGNSHFPFLGYSSHPTNFCSAKFSYASFCYRDNFSIINVKYMSV